MWSDARGETGTPKRYIKAPGKNENLFQRVRGHTRRSERGSRKKGGTPYYLGAMSETQRENVFLFDLFTKPTAEIIRLVGAPYATITKERGASSGG